MNQTQNKNKYMYYDFINKKYIITYDKEVIDKMNENLKMVFVENSAIPIKTTKKGTEWLSILSKIPKGKAWKVPEDTYNIQTIRSIVKKLTNDEKLQGYIVTQRTENDKVVIYVKHE